MTDFTRRSFLRHTSIGVVGAGIAATAAAASLPRLTSGSQQPAAAHGTLPTPLSPQTSPAATGTLPTLLSPQTSLAEASLNGPMLVHVRNVATAEIGVLVGSQEIVYRDPELVSRLVRTVRQAATVAG